MLLLVAVWRTSSYDDDIDGGVLVVGGDPGVDEDRRIVQASHPGQHLDQVPRPSVPGSQSPPATRLNHPGSSAAVGLPPVLSDLW